MSTVIPFPRRRPDGPAIEIPAQRGPSTTTESDQPYVLNHDDHPDAVRYVLDTIYAHHGAKVRFTDGEVGPYSVDRDKRVFWLPHGLPWRKVQPRLDRCVLYLVGGSAWAPEFRPELRLIHGGAR